jgi:Ser/Thr protein kinase RdoA (MazF antagonist)
MDPRSRDSFNPDIVTQACGCYAIDPAGLEMLGGFESFIYAYRRAGRQFILRLAHSLRYSYEIIRGELDWINFLADRGVQVSRPILSQDGRLAEKITAPQGYFTATAFEKAPGGPPSREDWETGLMKKVGRLLGKMHVLTQAYAPSDPVFHRPHWDYGLDASAEEYLPPGEEKVQAAWHALLARLRQLPRERDSYGLVHTDVHGGNFFVDRGQITLFDFGDCQYAWFAYDLAMALFYVLPHHCDSPEQQAFGRRALAELLEGYALESTLSADWLAIFPLFFKLREIDLYIAIHRSMDINNLDAWCASYMQGRRTRIENNVPFADIF